MAHVRSFSTVLADDLSRFVLADDQATAPTTAEKDVVFDLRDSYQVKLDGTSNDYVKITNSKNVTMYREALSEISSPSGTNAQKILAIQKMLMQQPGAVTVQTQKYVSLAQNALSTATNPTIFTTPANQGDFIIERVILIFRTITSAFTIMPVINVGTNSATFDNLVAGMTNAAIVINEQYIYTPTAGATGHVPIVPASTAVKAKVSVAGTVATVGTFDIYVEGFYTGLVS